jgi:hypothetical protein
MGSASFRLSSISRLTWVVSAESVKGFGKK